MIATITLNPAIDQTVQVDQLRLGAVNKVNTVVETAGGKGINVARVLADLGHEVTATGLMGDKNQPFFHDYLSHHQVTDAFVTVEGAVRTNIKLVNSADADVTDINFPGFNAAEKSLHQVLDSIKNLPANTFIAVCGSLPPGISAGAFEQFLQAIKSCGFRLAVDGSGEALQRAVTIKPDLIKPNIHELSELAGKELSTREALHFAEKLIEQGVKHVVLSCGAEGAWFLTKGQRTFARPGKVNVVSTVGAGDSMMAACLYGFEQGYTPEQVARLATACGMKAVSQAGVGGCSIDQLDELMATVDVSSAIEEMLFTENTR